MQIITSKENETIKNIRKLKEKKYREEEKVFIVEGIKLIKEAIEEKAKIDKIVVCEECIEDGTIEQKLLYEIAKYNCIYVTEKIFQILTDVQNPQGILAIISRKKEESKIDYNQDMLVILEDIQDPGNLGTIIRTVDSVGLNQIILSNGCADAYNPKVIRSTMGAIFRVNIIQSDNLSNTIKQVQKQQFSILATSLDTQDSVYDEKYNKTAIVIGNEANGVSQKILDIVDKKIKIPMLGKTESLNASVATGIVLYEYVRQKILTL